MLRFTCLFALMLASMLLPAQNIEWTWVGGDTVFNKIDVYGNRRVLDPVNKPGSVSPMANWTDKEGNFYMFGGQTITSRFMFDTIPVYSNGLWKYSPAKNAWAMVTGSNSSTPSTTGGGGVYGTPGSPAPENTPEILSIMGAHWTDAAGNWWLYGGKGGTRDFGAKSNVWKFDPAIAQWTVVRKENDDAFAVYGTKGVPASSNTPGARTQMIYWKDRDGYFYIYGGLVPYNYNLYSDLWRFDPRSGLWTWIGGKQWQLNVPELTVYGTKNVFDSANTPGPISMASQGFGEADADGVISLTINDRERWKYSVKTNQWAWLGGDRRVKPDPTPPRSYGIQGVSSKTNNPGPRVNAIIWTDSAKNQWLYGGGWVDTTSRANYLSDLWYYAAATGEWTWLAGDSTLGRAPSFGQQGVSSTTSHPGGRVGSVPWVDLEGNLWLFGGLRLAPQRAQIALFDPRQVNDLWKLTVKGIFVSTKINAFSAELRNDRVMLQWNTSAEKNTKEFIVERSRDSVNFTQIGKVPAAGNATAVSRYQFIDDNAGRGTVFYRLKLLQNTTGFEYSSIAKISIAYDGFEFRIVQNPVVHELKINCKNEQAGTIRIQVRTVAGTLTLDKRIAVSAGISMQTIPVGPLSPGVYFITIVKDNKATTKRFYKVPNAR